MKRFLLAAVLALGCFHAIADDAVWLTDIKKAAALARTEKKTVLVNFTGSDWCGFCIKLHKEVFNSDEFKEYTKKNLILVEADFPHNKQLAPELVAMNESLRNAYAQPFQGFPTVVLISASGKKLGEEVGYDGHGVAAYIARLDKIRAGK